MVSAPVVGSSFHHTLTNTQTPHFVSKKIGQPVAHHIYKCAVDCTRLQGTFEDAGGVAGPDLYAFQFEHLLASHGHIWKPSFITHLAPLTYAALVEPCVSAPSLCKLFADRRTDAPSPRHGDPGMPTAAGQRNAHQGKHQLSLSFAAAADLLAACAT
eukprot:4749028-Pleurochrysis_carterae.AAC.1